MEPVSTTQLLEGGSHRIPSQRSTTVSVRMPSVETTLLIMLTYMVAILFMLLAHIEKVVILIPNRIQINAPAANTVNEGTKDFNNKYGHDKGQKKGLNIVNSNGERLTEGTTPNGDNVTMEYVNIHSGKSDNGNYNSRGSHGCVTIHPDDADAF